MTSAIGKALASAGLLPPNAVRQFQRWNPDAVADIDPEAIPAEPVPPEVISPQVLGILSSKEQVDIRETDVDVMARFHATKTTAVLHIEDDEEAQDVDVDVGRTATGDFLFPWSSDGIEGVMTNGRTCLLLSGVTDVQNGIYFRAVRELYFGENMAFMVCTPYGLGEKRERL